MYMDDSCIFYQYKGVQIIQIADFFTMHVALRQ